MENDIHQEFEQAVKEGRQPLCPYCHNLLTIEENYSKLTVWKWNVQDCRYYKQIRDEGTSRPCCTNCEGELNFFMESSQLLCDLGLRY